MSKFTVRFLREITEEEVLEIDIEAETKEEAEEQAYKMYDSGELDQTYIWDNGDHIASHLIDLEVLPSKEDFLTEQKTNEADNS